ncbi:DUF5994 family protein [Mycolicibacterium chubuense]|nr:DUF5994 family protein [Mycolicibacterium chubuense]
MAKQLGADIDGAWWPYTSSVARELPELIGALQRPLGEIVDIRVNWSALDGQWELDKIVAYARLTVDQKPRSPRLMCVSGRDATAKLLVVPSITSQALGMMILRCLSGMPTWPGDGNGDLYETARRVLQIAGGESARWLAVPEV